MGYLGKKFKVFIVRDGKLIVQTWIQHFPTRTFQALELHEKEIKTGLISPDAEVLLDEKEVSIESGLSPRNLKYMRTFAAAWPDPSIVQRVVAQIPWRSNLALLEKLNDSAVRHEEFKGSLPTVEEIEAELGGKDRRK